MSQKKTNKKPKKIDVVLIARDRNDVSSINLNLNELIGSTPWDILNAGPSTVIAMSNQSFLHYKLAASEKSPCLPTPINFLGYTVIPTKYLMDNELMIGPIDYVMKVVRGKTKPR